MFTREYSCWELIDQHPHSCLSATAALQRQRTKLQVLRMSPSKWRTPSSANKNNAFFVKWIYIQTTRTFDSSPSSRVLTRAESTVVTSPDCAKSNKNAWSVRSTGASVPDTCRRTTKPSSSFRIPSCSIRNVHCVHTTIRSLFMKEETVSGNSLNKCI